MTLPPDYVVLVVGAGSGIGKAVATHLQLLGATVIGADRDAVALHELGQPPTVGTSAGTLSVCELDATDDRRISSAVANMLEAHGHLDALVNCVGINPDAGTPSDLVDLNTFDEVYRVNLRAAFALTQAVLPSMLSRGFGRIAHVASIAGKEGNPRMASYSATKAGLIGLVKALGREYATTGVTINAIAPAVIHTPLVDATSPEVVSAMLAKIPMGRPGELAEVASMLTWMISPECSYTTGFTFDLSGGRATY